MGLEFGELPIRIRKIVYYTLCSSNQRFWAKSVSHGLPNLFRRTARAFVPTVPALLMLIWCIKWSTAEYRRALRKNPKLYENDT
ncbi:PREDICTED: cytochrome b-c1 complex subunit 8-like [Eufriesea mexicana]|uniref:cytochrome b-c1 complex subunit 8-like n=1 Tax=Eufriesea mexicana TaxID=516756 RepID=UPI00083C492E|nr:PREDICTED: cytochrome b-c1 complex subunit 8-like [Eufriesea mexicana]